MGSLPNFFIIGAPKCGTTSLAAWLTEHPNVFMSPIKEPFYFSKDLSNKWRHSWNGYIKLFDKAKSTHKAVGEASTSYLYSKTAIPMIEETFPESLYIVMLRNPMEMAPSLHEQMIRSFHEDTLDFLEAWNLSPKRRVGERLPNKCKHPILLDYQSWCLLGEQVERLLSLVTQERVLITTLDDMKENPLLEYQKVLNFLGVPYDGRQIFPVHNSSRELRSPLIGRAIRSLAKTVAWSKHVKGFLPYRSLGIVRRLQTLNTQQKSRQPLALEFSIELEKYFAHDVKKLEKILGRDLKHWFSIHRAN